MSKPREKAEGAGFPGFTLLATQLWPKASSKNICGGRKLNLPRLFLCSGSEMDRTAQPPAEDTIHRCICPHTCKHVHQRTSAHMRNYTCKHAPSPPTKLTVGDMESREQKPWGPGDTWGKAGGAGSTVPPSTSPGWLPWAVWHLGLCSNLESKLVASEYLWRVFRMLLATLVTPEKWSN